MEPLAAILMKLILSILLLTGPVLIYAIYNWPIYGKPPLYLRILMWISGISMLSILPLTVAIVWISL